LSLPYKPTKVKYRHENVLSDFEDGGNVVFSQTMVDSYKSFYDNVLFQVIHYLEKIVAFEPLTDIISFFLVGNEPPVE
jgi:hypothetical protein